MDNNNGKKGNGGSGFIPSDRYERYSGPNKEIREQYRRAMEERERGKPDTQLASSSATSASNSKDKSR